MPKQQTKPTISPDRFFQLTTSDQVPDFIKLEYQALISEVQNLNDRRMAYQKMFAALMTVVGSVSVAILKANPNSSGINANNLVGLLLFLTAILGFSVIRNLAAVRRDECRYQNAFHTVRNAVINCLPLPEDYPTFEPSRASDRHTADYLAIATSSVVNFFFLITAAGLFAVGPILVSIVVGIVSIFYATAHYWFIEKFLTS